MHILYEKKTFSKILIVRIKPKFWNTVIEVPGIARGRVYGAEVKLLWLWEPPQYAPKPLETLLSPTLGSHVPLFLTHFDVSQCHLRGGKPWVEMENRRRTLASDFSSLARMGPTHQVLAPQGTLSSRRGKLVSQHCFGRQRLQCH